jgi:hypothetical protein
MKEVATNVAQDWMVLALAGLGITLAPHEFWGGLFMAMSAAMIARYMAPEKDQREVWLVLISAAVLAVFTAAVANYLRDPAHAKLPPDFPIQIAMAVVGFFSRFVISLALRMAGRVEHKADDLTDRVVDRFLPASQDKEGGQ